MVLLLHGWPAGHIQRHASSAEQHAGLQGVTGKRMMMDQQQQQQQVEARRPAGNARARQLVKQAAAVLPLPLLLVVAVPEAAEELVAVQQQLQVLATAARMRTPTLTLTLQAVRMMMGWAALTRGSYWAETQQQRCSCATRPAAAGGAVVEAQQLGEVQQVVVRVVLQGTGRVLRSPGMLLRRTLTTTTMDDPADPSGEEGCDRV